MVHSTFTHQGQTYEIHHCQTSDRHEVYVTQNAKPANPYRYVVTKADCGDINTMQDTDVVAALVRIAEDDVKSQRWQTFLSAARATQRK